MNSMRRVPSETAEPFHTQKSQVCLLKFKTSAAAIPGVATVMTLPPFQSQRRDSVPIL